MKKEHPYHDNSMWKGASSSIFARAKLLRENMTEAELCLWEVLKSNKLEGYKFRRQHPIHKFIVDFYCHKLKLIIEIDGEYHNTEEQILKDNLRTELLEFQDVKIIRFTNKAVLNNLKDVIDTIKSHFN